VGNRENDHNKAVEKLFALVSGQPGMCIPAHEKPRSKSLGIGNHAGRLARRDRPGLASGDSRSALIPC